MVKPGERIPKVVPSEHSEQSRFIGHARTFYPAIADCIAAIPNAGKRSMREGARLKAEGMLAGYPDVLIDVPRCGFHGLRIEFKRQDGGGGASASQKRVIRALRANGYAVAVCLGFNDAWPVFEDYMKGNVHPLLEVPV